MSTFHDHGYCELHQWLWFKCLHTRCPKCERETQKSSPKPFTVDPDWDWDNADLSKIAKRRGGNTHLITQPDST